MQELTTKLQGLCHDGHSLDEVLIDIDGKNTNFADIEVRRINVLGEKHQISLVALRR
ncbi:MAG: hypothetical protein IKP60_13815 [Treponema sp.]|nr:hypothetical protein [Treponema sp.]